MQEFYMIFARKIKKIPEIYMIFAPKSQHDISPKNIFSKMWSSDKIVHHSALTLLVGSSETSCFKTH